MNNEIFRIVSHLKVPMKVSNCLKWLLKNSYFLTIKAALVLPDK